MSSSTAAGKIPAAEHKSVRTGESQLQVILAFDVGPSCTQRGAQIKLEPEGLTPVIDAASTAVPAHSSGKRRRSVSVDSGIRM